MASALDHPVTSPSSSPTSHTTESHLPANPSTGAIWTELATITVAAFSEPVIARLRAFIANTPHFDHAHLQMLGPIAVRHVALMLAQPPSPSPADPPASPTKSPKTPPTRHSNCDSSQPTNLSPLPDRKHHNSRRSFRDFAYHAVRLNKIYPETLAVEPHPHRPNSLVRKLSITSTPPSGRPTHPSDPALQRHSSSHPALQRHSSSHVPRSRPDPDPRPDSRPRQRPERPLSLNNKPSATPAAHTPSPAAPRRKPASTRWRHQPGLPRTENAFPRASYADTLESSSLRDLKKRDRANENTLPDQLPAFPSLSSPPSVFQAATGMQPSRLVLLRRQREKKKSSVR